MVIGEKILISKNFTLGMGIWRYHWNQGIKVAHLDFVWWALC
jgi:hypothetical protein